MQYMLEYLGEFGAMWKSPTLGILIMNQYRLSISIERVAFLLALFYQLNFFFFLINVLVED